MFCKWGFDPNVLNPPNPKCFTPGYKIRDNVPHPGDNSPGRVCMVKNEYPLKKMLFVCFVLCITIIVLMFYHVGLVFKDRG